VSGRDGHGHVGSADYTLEVDVAEASGQPAGAGAAVAAGCISAATLRGASVRRQAPMTLPEAVRTSCRWGEEATFVCQEGM